MITDAPGTLKSAPEPQEELHLTLRPPVPPLIRGWYSLEVYLPPGVPGPTASCPPPLTLIVKLRISIPILPTSGAATSLTSRANWSLSW